MRPQVIAFAALLVGLTVLLLWCSPRLGQPQIKPPSGSASSQAPGMEPQPQPAPEWQKKSSTEREPRLAAPVPAPRSMAKPTLPEVRLTEPAPSAASVWEQQLDQILASTNTTDLQKARQLLDLLPGLPPEGMEEATDALTDLVTDEEYDLPAQLLLSPTTPSRVYELVLADLSDRPNHLKLPLLLQVARMPDHPESGEALEDLAFFLDADFGSDWDQWERSLALWLAENPE